MAIQYNTDLLGKFYAPGISDFTVFYAPILVDTHPEAPHWLTNHFLNSVFRGEYKNKYRQYAINQIYRAQVAFGDYHEARALTTSFLEKGRPDNPASRAYFQAVARWESCLLNVQIFIDVMNKMRKDFKCEPVFEEGDGTPEQRAYGIANLVKHWGTELFAGRHDEGETVPLWLTNAGIKTRIHEITYVELSNLVSEVATVANELQDPKSFAGTK